MEMPLQELYDNIPRLKNIRIKNEGAACHTIIIPEATYSPWYEDQEFMEIYNAVMPFTLVNDLYRCYELWKLVPQISALGLGDILEVGVWRGGTGCLMAYRAQNSRTSKKVFLCDTFTGVVKASEKDTQYEGGEHADTSIEAVQILANKLGLKNIEILQGIFPEDTAHQIADRKFSLCHIDVDVYESARDITNWVWPRLTVGGCIVYDDYGFSSCDGVTRFVNEYTPKAGAIVLHNLNGHAIIVKVAP